MNYNLFSTSLKKINIYNDDLVMIHVDLSNFPGENWINKSTILINFLKKYFSNKGSIIIPSFTYSFCNSRIYDEKKSPSEVGIFSEFFRQQKDIIRSDHPIFSFSCWGKYKDILSKNNSNSSTGSGSIFEKFYSLRGKILFLNTEFISSCVFLHFVEQSVGVPYRYSKNFRGKTIINSRNKIDNFEFYVRSEEYAKFINKNKKTFIEKDLIKAKIIKKINFDKKTFSSCSAEHLFNFTKNKLYKNIFYILDSKSKKIK
jgi:aminoglycoside 3-N-acetyltransferase